MLTIGYFAHQSCQCATSSSLLSERPSLARRYCFDVGVVELAGRRVEGDDRVLARPVARRFDGGEHDLDGVAVAGERRREPALVADVRREACGRPAPS